MCVGAYWLSVLTAQVIVFSVGATFLCLAGLALRYASMEKQRHEGFISSARDMWESDPGMRFVCDRSGRIQYLNPAGKTGFKEADSSRFATMLNGVLANPSEIMFRLQSKAQALGSATDEVTTHDGPTRLTCCCLYTDLYSWHFEPILTVNPSQRSADALSIPMLTASKSGTILFMNEAFRRLIGSRVKTLDRVFTDLPLRSGSVHEVSCVDSKVRACVVCIEGGGGRQEVYLVPDEYGHSAGEANAGELDFFDEIPVALLRLHPEGSIISANRQARSLLETNISGDMVFTDLIEGLGRSITDWIRETAQRGTQGQSEVLKARNTKAEKFLQVSLSRLGAESSTQIIAVLNDATELKTLEAQFVQSQKMQAIGQLAGGVAHDFNNLLTAISGHCDLLLLRHDQGDSDHEDLVQIHQNANRAASLVGQLLAFSRKQNLRPEVLDLRETLSDLTHLLNRLVGEQLSLSWSHDPGLGAIKADKRQLEQVIMNLVVNARDAMPDGGEIRIETTSRTLTEPFKRDRAELLPGNYACIEVIDQGTGIPKDKLAKIFEPFFTTKRVGEGTGLGLSTAYGIVKQTGGFIFADSIVGVGTTFSLYFPVYSGVATVSPPKSTAPLEIANAPAGEGVVLLVEDEAPVRAFASRALRMRGYTVLEAENAEEALKTLEDGSLAVDLFVTDVVMPGMDGPSWVKQAREARPDVKVVFVSGYAEERFEDDQMRIPNSVFLPKPFSLNDLTNVVQEQMS
ncbi:ATP-binding protein [Algirhabdus cladophorae]|uniref:ATP-binding protein n=1 Tax=Algirhabdus cladophorae TaxID=3377108 RepID=UPI003B848425